MESSKQRLQTLMKVRKSRRTLQVLALVSLSVVLVLVSDLSWLPGSVASMDIFLVSSLVSGFLQYYMNKTVVFLLCNGILVIVSGCPGFFTSSYNSPHEEAPDRVPSETHFQEPKALAPRRRETSTEETEWAVVNFAAEEEEEGEKLELAEEQCKELQVFTEHVKREDEDEEAENEGILYSGESDARFEDFIRRTKEGMRIEARQLILMV